MENNTLTKLPDDCLINVFKFQCNQPSLFTFYLAKNPDLNSGGLTIHTKPITFSSQYSSYDIRHFYYQLFNIFGNTSADFSDFGNRIYNGEDFYLEYNYPEESKNYSYTLSNTSNTSSLSLSFTNNGSSKEKIAKENEKNLYSSFLIFLDPSKKNKYIKVQSTNKFYYCYQFSQTEDLNYFPSSCGFKSLAHGNITYINNPYYYNDTNMKTNYKWFIFIRNYMDGEQYYKYKYTNEIWENEKDEEGSNEVNENNPTSFAGKLFLGIGIVLIIGIIIFLAYFYISKKKNSTENENLINKVENKKLYSSD
jgi:hypothetical protein